MWLLPPGIGVTILWRWAERRIDRGRRRVEEATPKLIALGNRVPIPSLALELNNVGRGEAMNVIISLDGCERNSPPVARIPPGTRETTEQLFYDDSPIYSRALDNLCLHICYQSIYGLSYKTVYKVTQQQRDDRNYNPHIDFGSHSFADPSISWLKYFELGK